MTNAMCCANILLVAGELPLASQRGHRGSIAQLGEHLPYKQRVTGSSPVVPTMWPGSSVG